MTNIKKYSALSLIAIASLVSFSAQAKDVVPHSSVHAKESMPKSSELVMYRGMIMTPDEYAKQKNFESSLTYDSQRYNRNYMEEDEIVGGITVAPIYHVTVVPTSEVQKNVPLTRKEVIDEYVRARDSGELDRMYKEVYGNN